MVGLDADSGRGVSHAVVQVGPLLRIMGPSGAFEESLSAYTSGMRYIVADGDGRFVVRNLGKGRYALIVRMNGYMFSSFGQKRPGAPTREIELDGVQRVDDVVILAWKKGVITGVITDEAGAPAVDVPVRALRRTFAAGRARFASVTLSNRTDDRGEVQNQRARPGRLCHCRSDDGHIGPDAGRQRVSRGVRIRQHCQRSRLQRDASGLGAAL